MNMESGFEVLVVGAGPAGLSAATWCGELGLRCGIVESEPVAGGQLKKIFNPIGNYPGIIETDGERLSEAFVSAAANSGARLIFGSPAVSIDPTNYRVSLKDGRELSASSLVIATGVRRRRLGVPGEDRFVGRGIIESGSKDPAAVEGHDVLIVGGGDAAAENAAILAPFATKVTLVHRGPSLSAREEFVRQIADLANVTVRLRTVVRAFEGGSELAAASLQDLDSGKEMRLDVDRALIRIGVEPNSEIVRGKLDLDERGYIRVASDTSTERPGVFAAGDVANPVSPTIVTAAGTGAIAAKAAHAWLNRLIAV